MAKTNQTLEKLTSAIPDELRGDLHARIQEEKQKLIDALMDLAKGAWYHQKFFDKDGNPYNEKIYQKLPDKEVAQYLLNQIIGKPKETATQQGRVIFEMDE